MLVIFLKIDTSSSAATRGFLFSGLLSWIDFIMLIANLSMVLHHPFDYLDARCFLVEKALTLKT